MASNATEYARIIRAIQNTTEALTDWAERGKFVVAAQHAEELAHYAERLRSVLEKTAKATKEAE